MKSKFVALTFYQFIYKFTTRPKYYWEKYILAQYTHYTIILKLKTSTFESHNKVPRGFF